MAMKLNTYGVLRVGEDFALCCATLAQGYPNLTPTA